MTLYSMHIYNTCEQTFLKLASNLANDIEADDITVATQFRPGLITEVKSTIIRI